MLTIAEFKTGQTSSFHEQKLSPAFQLIELTRCQSVTIFYLENNLTFENGNRNFPFCCTGHFR